MPVYLIRAGDAGPVKIGFSDSVHQRVVKIQADTPEPISILRILDGGRELEAALHARFASARLRGEWFSFSDDMLGELGVIDLSIRKTGTVGSGKKQEWSVERRAQTATRLLAMYADPARRDARDAKARVTNLRRVRLESMGDVKRRVGTWDRLATAVGLPIADVMAWQSIPIQHLETVAELIRVPVTMLAAVAEGRAA